MLQLSDIFVSNVWLSCGCEHLMCAFIEVWILSFCETWWENFSSIKACHVDLTAAWLYLKIWHKIWAVQLNIQRLLWNQTIIQSLMLESLRILSYCTELSLLLLFIIKISLHTLTWETKIRNFRSMSKIFQILFSLLLVVVVVVSYYRGVKINRCIDASRCEREQFCIDAVMDHNRL